MMTTDELRLPEKPLHLCSKEEMARRLYLKPMRCLVEDCTGRLIVRHQTDYANADRGGRVGSDLIPLLSIGCTGLTMHVWRKEDLWYLRPNQPRVVTNLQAVSNEVLAPGAPTPPPTPPGWETSPGHHLQE